MAHEMSELDTAMYGSDMAAWHGLGTVVSGQPGAAEAILHSGLGWQVALEDLFLSNGIQVPDRRAIVRMDLTPDDVRRILGVCGKNYVPVQNTECFAIADALVGEGGAQFETAGSLRNGQIVYMTAVLPDAMKVQDDTLSKYLLITSSHDGSGALVVMYTPIRVVCRNTLNLALKGNGQRVSIRHTKSATDRITEAKRILKNADVAFTDLRMQFLAWAQRKIDNGFADAYLKCLIPGEKTRGSNIRNEIARLYQGGQRGASQEAVSGTAYGLFNAVAEYSDHKRSLHKRPGVSDTEVRFESATLGSGADLKMKAGALLTKALENRDVLVATN